MKIPKVNATATSQPRNEDVVNRPNHYAPNGRDSFMHMKDQMGKEAFDGFLQGNVIKYVQRYQFKGKPVEDLEKAMFYLFHLYLDNGGAQERIVKIADHAWEHFRPEGK